MKKNRIKILLTVICSSFLLTGNAQSNQMLLSEHWEGNGGLGAMFNKTVTKTDQFSNVYIAGTTINGVNNSDILIQKFSKDGVLLWHQQFAGIGAGNDYATDLFIDNQGFVYLTGAIVDSSLQGSDLVVLKYDSNGVFHWKYSISGNSSFMVDDLGTAITGDNMGKIYVAGSLGNNISLMDYTTIAIDASTGQSLWLSNYDYDSLLDIPSLIKYHIDGTVHVIGASQYNSEVLKWEVTLIKYNANNGSELGVSRTNTSYISQSGIEIGAICIDDYDNLYLTGTIYNDSTNNNDVALIKFGADLQMLNLNMYDYNGLYDKGTSIKVSSSGDIYITGYSTSNSFGREVAVMKVSNTGTLVWKREISGPDGLHDEGVQIALYNDYLYVLAKINRNNNYDLDLYMLKQANGSILTSITYDAANLHDEPKSLTVDEDGEVIISGVFQTDLSTFVNKTFKYKVHNKSFIPYLNNNGLPIFNQNELTIRFNKNYLKDEPINKKNFIAGKLADFLDPIALSILNKKLGKDLSNLETFKIFKKMTKADSISITRLGQTVKVEPFWATLSVMFPDEALVQDFVGSIESIKDVVLYAERNLFGTTNNVIPNDYHINFHEQYSLKGSYMGIEMITMDSNAQMTEQGAWRYEVGKSGIKVGVFDTGINWRHEDFGDGTWGGSVVRGGWDYGSGSHPSSQNNSDHNGHGTACAGVIGAIRNNGIGIAGIAGGDEEENIAGVSLYTMRILHGNSEELSDSLLDINTASEAILEGALYNPNTNYGFGLHVHNHSWSLINSHPEFEARHFTLRNVMHTAFKNGCVQVAASGNVAWNEVTRADTAFYPASFNDEWILKTGALCSNGIRCDFSAYGNNLDLIAPGSNNIVYTLSGDNPSGYRHFAGTSAAAPHVSGVASLLLSMHNPDYNSLYPNKLEQEDVEYISQKYATVKNQDDLTGLTILPVPNELNGYGALNAYKVLMHTSLPYRVRHYEHNISTDAGIVHSANQVINFPEGIDGLPLGASIGTSTIYKVVHTFNHTLPINEIFVNGWERKASSDLYGLTDVFTTSNLRGVELNSINSSTATLTGYYYVTQIITPDSIYYTRFPKLDNSSTFRFSYSIHTKDLSINLETTEINNEDGILLFPNPTNDILNITINNNREYELIIYDVTGREIEKLKFPIGTKNTTVNLASYTKGVYVFEFNDSQSTLIKRIIKN